MNEKIVQTAGRDQLGEFAPEFAHFNDDILFGENWNNQDIDVKTRSIITVVALMSQGITDNSLKYHIMNAKNHGVTQKEMAAIITHVAFYAGWLKSWAVFLSIALRQLPLGTAYAMWTGMGIVGTTLLGIFLFNEKLSVPQVICVILIVVGIAGLKLLAKD